MSLEPKRPGRVNRIDLTELERSLIIGTVLGDGYIGYGNSKAKFSARLQISHSWKQKDLVDWKHKKLQRLVKNPPKKVENGGYGDYLYRFVTRCYAELAEIKHLFWINGKREVTKEGLEMLTDPIGLAAWYMDDGSRPRGASLVMHTQSFSVESVEALSVWLREFWGVRSQIAITKKGQPTLAIRAESGEHFLDLVRDHLVSIPVMEHKILSARESLFCSFCGKRFVIARRTIQEGVNLLTCGSYTCREAQSAVHSRMESDRRRGLYTT